MKVVNDKIDRIMYAIEEIKRVVYILTFVMIGPYVTYKFVISMVEAIKEEPVILTYKGHTYFKYTTGTLHDPECKKCLEMYD